MFKKKSLYVVLLGLMLNMCVISGGRVKAATDSNYSRADAANYAAKWALSYNTKKYYKASLDCTNFVSQCLAAGGKKVSTKLPSYTDTNYWKPHSATWENANYFKKYWTQKVVSKGKSISGLSKSQKNAYASSIYDNIYMGDVVQYGTGTDSMKHSQICYAYGRSSSGYATLLMAQHTGNQKGISLHDYLQTTGYTYVRYYKMKEKK